MSDRLIIGMDPTEKDGTVSIVATSDEKAFQMNMNWRAAITLMLCLHDMIHAAAENAGIECDEVHHTIDAMAEAMREAPEPSDG